MKAAKERGSQCLIDGDVLRYEIGFGAEYPDAEGNPKVRDFDMVKNLFDMKIETIMDECQAYEDPIIYLTNDAITHRILNRKYKTEGTMELSEPFRAVFRHDLATVKPYKGGRKNSKPAHYQNLTAYILREYQWEVGNGVEADDLMAIKASRDENVIICSRDKDLRQVPGWHYSWECGKQAAIGPVHFDKKGYIEEVIKYGEKHVFGGGEMFFLYQLLVGEAVDNIPGCPKVGHVKAMKILTEDLSRKQAYLAVLAAYRDVYGDQALTHLTEQARLLWLLRRPNEIWDFPYYEE